MQMEQEQILAMAKKWRIIYPAYIDSTLKTSEGRRLGKEQCIDYPNLQEMSEVLSKLQMPHIIEGNKVYSKDILKVGRIKVKIAGDDGTKSNPEIKNSKRLKIKIFQELWLLKTIVKYLKANPKRKVKKPEFQSIEAETPPMKKKDKKKK